jgi:hypothetical protein
MSTSANIFRTIRRWAWGTPVRKGITIGLVAGLSAIFFIPAMGLAIGGTAFAIWGWVAAAVVGLTTYIGSRIGAMFGTKRKPLSRP